jgi:hypothetical protein
MTAKEKFKINQRVRLSAMGRAAHIEADPETTGTVVGYGRAATEIRVLRDGLKTPNNYQMDFWKRQRQ